MNRISTIGAAIAIASAVAFAGLTGCTNHPNSAGAGEQTDSLSTAEIPDIKGDLALFQLQGDVKSLEMDGEEYRFDENGILIVDGARETVNDEGKKCIIFDELSEDVMHGPSRPYMRIYGDDGKVQEVWTYYGSMQQLKYGGDGRLADLSWGDEGYSGKESYTYDDGIMVLCDSHDYGFENEQDKTSSSYIIAYDVDAKGNWTRRFLIVNDDEDNLINYLVQDRTIYYYSGPQKTDPERSKLLLSGKVVDDWGVVLGFKEMTAREDRYVGYMIYGDFLCGVSDLIYDFPKLEMKLYRLDGSDEYELKGELSADPSKNAYVDFEGTLNGLNGSVVQDISLYLLR